MAFDQNRVGELLTAACNFQGKSLAAREECRAKYREQEQNADNILRILIDGTIASLAQQMTGKVANVDEKTSYQIGVSASFVRTHYVVSDMILNGDLVEAIVLIRKQLESLVRLHELDSKPLEKLSGKVPNIQNMMKGAAGRMYGELSEVAHFSKPRVAALLHVFEKGELIGPSLHPIHMAQADACFDLNAFVAVYFIAWMVEKLPTWYPAYTNGDEDKELVGNIVIVALEQGVIRPPDEAKSKGSASGPSK